MLIIPLLNLNYSPLLEGRLVVEGLELFINIYFTCNLFNLPMPQNDLRSQIVYTHWSREVGIK